MREFTMEAKIKFDAHNIDHALWLLHKHFHAISRDEEFPIMFIGEIKVYCEAESPHQSYSETVTKAE